jgi:hypothetical protein
MATTALVIDRQSEQRRQGDRRSAVVIPPSPAEVAAPAEPAKLFVRPPDARDISFYCSEAHRLRQQAIVAAFMQIGRWLRRRTRRQSHT